MCGLTSTTLAGNTPTVGTGAWSIVSGAGGSITTPSSPTSAFSGTAGTTYVLRWTISNSPCTASTDDVTITFQRNPTTANAGADQVGSSMCGLTSTTLAGNTPTIGTGAWSIVSGTGGSITTPSSPTSTFSGTAGTTYTLRWTISNSPCTASTDDVTITFQRNPTTANAGADQVGSSMCGLTSTTLAGNTPTIGTGAWSIVSGTGGSITTPSSPTSTFSGTAGTTYTLRWTISNSPCTASTDDVTITFQRNPTTANAGADQVGSSMCGLTSTTLAGNTPTIGTGAWSIVSGSGGSITTPSSPTSTFSGTAGTTYTLRWTISNSPCTASTDDVTITFQRNPTTANAGADQVGSSMCGLTSTTLAGNSPTIGTGAWSIVSGTGGSITTPSSPTSTFSGTAGTTYTLRWTISNSPCTASTDDVTITFLALPAQPTITPSGSTTFCIGGSVTLTSSAGTSYLWSTGAITQSINVTASGSYTVQVTNANGCQSVPSAATVVTVNALPSQPTITPTGSTTFCIGGSVTLTSSAGTSYLWSTGAITQSINVTTSGSYTVQVTNANGCQSVPSAATVVTVNPLPSTPTITAGGPTTFCAGGSVTLTSTAGAYYLWSTGATTQSINVTTSGSYTVQVTNSNGCQSALSVPTVVTVNPLPLIDAISGLSSVCVGASIQLTNTTGGGTWSSLSPTRASVNSSGLVTGISAGSSEIRYTVTNGNSCTDYVFLTVTVNALPTIAAITGTPTVCAGSTTQLSDATAGGDWSSASPSIATISSTGLVSGVSAGSSVISYTVTNVNGCTSFVTQTVTVNALPVKPSLGTITQPTCALATGSVVLGSLPAGTWTINPGAISGSGTPTTISGLAAGTYNFTVTNSSGCTSTASDNVLINTQPPTPVVPNQTTSIMSGGTFNVTPVGVPVGTTYTWTAPIFTSGVTGTGAQSSPQSNISGTLSIPSGIGTATYTVTPVSGSCTGNTFTVTVTVTSTCVPVIIDTQPTNKSMCATSGVASFTVVAGNSSPFTYQWQYYNGATSTWANVANGSPAGANYSNATTATLDVTGITAPGNYQYRCRVTNCGGANNATSSAATLTVNAPPSAPTVGTITQPTCNVSTGSVVLGGLPATGTWTVISTPGSIMTTGTGTSTTIINLAQATTYTFTVTDGISTCTSLASGNVGINAQPLTPTPPTVGAITPPSCPLPTGSVVLGGLPASGTWTLTRYPLGITSTGTGSITTIEGLLTGSYNYTVANASGCVSGISSTVVIPAVPPKPAAPGVGTITQPTCASATGSVVLTGLPAGSWEVNPGAITGSTSTTTISGLSAGTYNYTVTNSIGCISLPSLDIVIDPQPPTPSVSNQTTTIPSGGTFNVAPVGVPGGTTYTWLAPTYSGDVSGGVAQTIPQSNITGTLIIPTGTGTATYIVTPKSGLCVGATFTLTVTVTSSCIPVTIVSQPADDSMCATVGSASFSVTTGGSAPYVYQWQYYNGATWESVVTGLPSGASYSNANSSALGVSGITAAGNYLYRCYITNCSNFTDATTDAATLTVNAPPAAPTVGTITQPTCAVATGSVLLSGLPAGDWTINPGAITGSTASTTIPGLTAGTYNYTVTNSLGCTSSLSGDIVLTQPTAPSTPVASVTLQPTCDVATGTIVVTSPVAGSGYEYSVGGAYQSGTTFTGLSSGDIM